MQGAWCLLWLTMGAAAAAQAPAPAGGTASGAESTEATVTFYSAGSLLHSALPFTTTHVFQGCIFEGDKNLACITWLRYAVVKLAPGLHVFSASLSERHGAANSQTTLVLEAGKSYFLRTIDKHKVDWVVPTTLHSDKGFLEAVSCEVAAEETADFAPAGVPIAGKDWARRPRDGAPACPTVVSSP